MNRLQETAGIVAYMRNWPLFFKQYVTQTSKEYRIFEFRDGLKMGFRDRDDASIIKETIALDYYRVRRQGQPQGVIIDIGAHIGAFTCFAAHCFPRTPVHCFEPDDANRQWLEKNVAYNLLENVHVHGDLVTADGRKVNFYRYANTTAGSMYAQPNMKPTETLTYPARSLMNILEDYGPCSVLKLDCEGAEFDLLLHTQDKLLKQIPYFAFEYHEELTGRKKEELVRRGQSLGFRVQEMRGEPIMYWEKSKR